MKLAEFRAKFPNPLGKKTEFTPDPEGNGIDAAGNIVVIGLVTDTTARNGKALDKLQHGKGCGCPNCKQMLADSINDNSDRANWLTNQKGSRWEVRDPNTPPPEQTMAIVPIRKSKKRR